ncbi:MAG TPA: EAL domain-containing protein [Kineosporiaceae bacterium]|nr:EAL domain-containing protein [Kineosporiaceae bacterium]
MTEVEEPAAPSQTTRTAAVRRFSQRWAAALAKSGRVSGTDMEIAGQLRPLTARLAHAVQTGLVDAELPADVGTALVKLGYGTEAVLGPTVVTLLDSFAEDFGALRNALGDTLLRERVTAAVGAMAEGFAQATRDHALAAQEELQRAALASVRTAITERHTSEARFRAVFAQAAVGIGLISMTGRVIDANAAWAAMMGYEVAQMRGLTMTELVTPGGSRPALRRFEEVLVGTRDHFRLEIAHENRNGNRLHLDLSVSTVKSADGTPDFLVGVAVDITERKRLEDRLWQESRHDPLTGLPNRTLFFEHLDALLTLLRPERPVGICYIDLDGFKSINDGLGHDVGDRLLIRVASRLSDAVTAPGSLLARLGGDEFGVLSDGGDPGDQAGRILAALAEPITIDGRELSVSASIGVVDTVTAGSEAAALMRAADITLYQAKARGRGRWERHDPQRNAHQVTRHTLATEMSAALSRGEFFLDYQPLVSLRDGVVRRVEALVRWRHPRLGLLQPDEFIGMAEENGHIVALGRWVLRTASQAAAEWYRKFPEAEVGVNVNVAVGQLSDPGLSDHVRTTLIETGLPPHLLYLELTESAVLGEAPGPVDALTGLAADGVRLVIDDFGTGYSNLVHLSRLPACELKIAGSFLQASPTGDLTNDKILPAIISLAHSLGLTVTAEGVECVAQADRLRELDCDTAQGWYFGCPGPPEKIEKLICG